MDSLDLAFACIKLAELCLRADVPDVELTQAAVNVVVWIGRTMPDTARPIELLTPGAVVLRKVS